MTNQPVTIPEDYGDFLSLLKERIRSAQGLAALSIHRHLVLLYWQIGRDILARQEQAGWGAKVIDRLANDLRRAFPEMKGLSARNLKYMRALAEAWPDEKIVQQLVAQIPWGHNVRLLDAIKDPAHREWYIRQTIEHGWSRSVLIHQIESNLFERQGRAVTNFKRTLPAPQSELAQQLIKDPYNFDFLSLAPEARERELHRGLLGHLREFLIELGVGFAYVGSEYHLSVGDRDFYVDLLFYHLKLRCFVVFDLKISEFEPEFAGKMGFYLSAVDDALRQSHDQPTIGIILCKQKNKVIVEYALRDMSKPVGVSEYRLTPSLPLALKGQLPAFETLDVDAPPSSEKPILGFVQVTLGTGESIDAALQAIRHITGVSVYQTFGAVDFMVVVPVKSPNNIIEVIQQITAALPDSKTSTLLAFE